MKYKMIDKHYDESIGWVRELTGDGEVIVADSDYYGCSDYVKAHMVDGDTYQENEGAEFDYKYMVDAWKRIEEFCKVTQG